MPLDVRGRTRATLTVVESLVSSGESWGQTFQSLSCLGSGFVTIPREPGIPSKHRSSACAEYVPALCTHRPSLLPIEWFSKVNGSTANRCKLFAVGKLAELDHLEEVQVVTRFP